MHRLTEYYRDKDVTIWACAHGYPHDVVEFPTGGKEPSDKVCGAHGEPLLKRCPNKSCPDPIYHPDDFEQRFHRPCGEKIPWAERRRAAAEIDYEPFTSKYVGRVARPHLEAPIRPQSEFVVPKELTPEQRGNLIVPPSERLPAAGADVLATQDLDLTRSSNLNRYLLVVSRAVDRPPRQVAQAIVKFFRDRGRVVGRGADKGLEDAVTLIVKTLIVLGVFGLLALFGLEVASRH